jgi:hypothetical protein
MNNIICYSHRKGIVIPHFGKYALQESISHTKRTVNVFFKLTCLVHWATPRSFSRDGIHFTSEGSKIVVKEIMKVLTEADWEPSLHWKSLPAEFAEDSPYDPVSLDGKTTVNVSEISYHRETENS